MIKTITVLACSLFFIITPALLAQTNQDVIYHKNGSIIKGDLLEIEISGSLRIETLGGSQFVYQTTEINRIELARQTQTVHDNDNSELVSVVHLKNGSIIRGQITEIIPAKTVSIETYGGSLFVNEIENIERIQLRTETSRVNPMTQTRSQDNSADYVEETVSETQASGSVNNTNTESQSLNATSKDPNTALLLGIIIPGAGHIYSGESGTGLLLLGISVSAPLLGWNLSDWDDMTPYYIGLGVAGAAYLYSIIDSPKSARRVNLSQGIAVNESIRITPDFIGSNIRNSGFGVSLKGSF